MRWRWPARWPSHMAATRASCVSRCCAACCTTWARCTSPPSTARPTPAARAQPALVARLTTAEIQDRLGRLDAAMQSAQFTVSTLMLAARTPALKDALGLAQHLLGRLRAGWNASGLWSDQAVASQDAAEVEAVEDELLFRLRAIERAAVLRAGELPEEDAQRLRRLCD